MQQKENDDIYKYSQQDTGEFGPINGELMPEMHHFGGLPGYYRPYDMSAIRRYVPLFGTIQILLLMLLLVDQILFKIIFPGLESKGGYFGYITGAMVCAFITAVVSSLMQKPESLKTKVISAILMNLALGYLMYAVGLYIAYPLSVMLLYLCIVQFITMEVLYIRISIIYRGTKIMLIQFVSLIISIVVLGLFGYKSNIFIYILSAIFCFYNSLMWMDLGYSCSTKQEVLELAFESFANMYKIHQWIPPHDD